MAKIFLFGEILLRIDMKSNEINNSSISSYVGGSELNVASCLSFNNEVYFISKLGNNEISENIIDYLKRYKLNLNVELINKARNGVYFHYNGYGYRSGKIIYDRNYSAFVSKPIKISEINFNVDLIHTSAITSALSNNYKMLVIDVSKKCMEESVKFSYDCNYRRNLWSIRNASVHLKTIIENITILFASKWDFINLLGFNKNFSESKIIFELFSKYKNLEYVCFTSRTIFSSSSHSLMGYIYTRSKIYRSKEFNFDVIDRIGCGDNFSSVVIDGIINNHELDKVVEKAVYSSVIQHTYYGDYTKHQSLNINDVGLLNR